MELIMEQFPIVIQSLNVGFLQTLKLFFVTLLGALPLGLIIAFGSMSHFRPLKYITNIIVWVVRGTPLMIQMLIIYYFPGLVLNNVVWGGGESGRFVAASVAFIFNYACYFSVIYRGGIQSVPQGQTEAGLVLGMTSLNFLTVWGVAQFDERAKLIEKYRAFLHAEPAIRDGAQAAPKSQSGEIKLEHLTFTYPGGAAPVLQDINLTIHPGEKIALVGYNGAGKTTLTNLLLRLYEPTGGRILIGGQDIRDCTLQSHRDRFAAVFQDFQLFACRVGENVALSPQFDPERVRRALDHSGFQRPLPRGVDTQLLREFDDDGLMLSGGESQKVAVARAFYKDCPFVILDEPSANLDPVAEYQLNRAMLEAARDKTVIFISHRLSTTVQADKIYVMEQGRIIESGSHSELMAADGTYAYMFRLQAEKYKNAKSE